MCNLLDVEANGGDGGDNLPEFELVKDGRFTSGIQADHEDSHFLLAQKASESLGNGETHGVVLGTPGYSFVSFPPIPCACALRRICMCVRVHTPRDPSRPTRV